MNEQERKRIYRARIQEKSQKIRAEDVFLDPSYLELLRSIAKELTDGRLEKVRLYSNPAENSMGRCDGQQIWLNLGNRVTESFSSLQQKNLSLIGVLGHECGHKNYSDFYLREKYINGILNGIWYPYPPEAKTRQEEQDLQQIRGYFESRNPEALSLIVQVAAYLNNLLEDLYIEEKMCARFPGSIRRGILLNRERNVEWLPTLRELVAEQEDKLSILMNLCCQYAFCKRINNWDQEEHELLDVAMELMPVIWHACENESSSERFHASNRILLMIWKYLYEIIQKMEKRKEEEKEEQKEEKQKEKQEGENGSAQENEQTGAADATKESEVAKGAANEGTNEETNVADAMQEYLEHLRSRLPQFIQTPSKEINSRRDKMEESWTGSWERATVKSEEAANVQENMEKNPNMQSSADGKKEDAVNTSEAVAKANLKLIDADGPLQQILHRLAKEQVDAQIEQERRCSLQKELEETDFSDGHAQVKKCICRESTLTKEQLESYQTYEEQVKKIQRRLYAALLPILQAQGKRTERRLFLGTRIDLQSIAHPQGAIYKKSNPGKKVDLALAILIDMSGSMSGMRIEQSKAAALSLYAFCKKAGIPVSVYGHHTDGYHHRNLEDETVYLHCCADFEQDAKDRYRIALLQPRGANRDGVALRFLGKKLMKRPEKQKLLIVISDGLPNSNQYRGKPAEEDLKKVKKELTQNGIVCLAAAIGEDKERIKEIYQESFLDISEIEVLPAVLAKQLVKYIRRTLE